MVMSGTDDEKWLGEETGIKLAISGVDIVNSRVDLRLIVQNNEIAIQPWNPEGKAVEIWDSDE